MRMNKVTGFSLVELMVVVVLVTIMATAAVTGLMELVHSVRVKSASQGLFSTLLLARSEAAKRNLDVTVTPVDEDDWGAGWDVGAGGELIYRQQALKGVAITLGPAAVTYNHHGRLPDGTAPPHFQIQVPGDASGPSRCLEIDLSGRASTYKGGCV